MVFWGSRSPLTGDQKAAPGGWNPRLWAQDTFRSWGMVESHKHNDLSSIPQNPH